ncbi:MAG: trypsin-like peptidase domain-containing protein, partial [Burkholderiales bacterium]|nr:trypsin-like peptidase domain-containing protein [Burkholderiales bacterium]
MPTMLQRLLLVVALAVPLTVGQAVAQHLPDFTELVEQQGPTVVNISTRSSKPQPQQQTPGEGPSEDDPFFDFFRRYGPPGQQQPQEREARSLGSGFIISEDGYIMTNAHVVEAGDDITVRLGDPEKREFTAKVIGSDRR